MSLIQDALKRKSEEEVKPLVPPIAGIAGQPTAGKSPQLLLIGLILLLTAGLLAAMVGLGLYLVKPTPAVATKTIITASAAPEPATAPQGRVQAVETVVTASVAEPVIAKKEPAPEVKPVWPELLLTGIAQGDGQALAILNGKMISAGRKLGTVTILEVNSRDIVVEYCGERRTLYVGE